VIRRHLRSLLVVAVAAGACVLATPAGALADDGGATWRLEQPLPPPLAGGSPSGTPIGLGRIGDIEFWAPNRGLLITAGNPPTISPGVWAYDGVSWHELATECGATDGRIAWAGPDEFWTVSDGRPGQANIEGTAPLADNTLCHFSGGEIVGSFASLAFRPSSYQAMHGAGCVGPEDCWFGGDALPEGQVGAFHLHWNGHALEATPSPQGHAAESTTRFGGLLYEGVRIKSDDLLGEEESASEPSDIHVIEPNGVRPSFVSLFPGFPLYSSEEFPEALDFPDLSADTDALWSAANPAVPTPAGSTPAEVTVQRFSGGSWSQLLGIQVKKRTRTRRTKRSARSRPSLPTKAKLPKAPKAPGSASPQAKTRARNPSRRPPSRDCRVAGGSPNAKHCQVNRKRSKEWARRAQPTRSRVPRHTTAGWRLGRGGSFTSRRKASAG
jgi:hypothetical protein